jgi:hypothetical protein
MTSAEEIIFERLKETRENIIQKKEKNDYEEVIKNRNTTFNRLQERIESAKSGIEALKDFIISESGGTIFHGSSVEYAQLQKSALPQDEFIKAFEDIARWTAEDAGNLYDILDKIGRRIDGVKEKVKNVYEFNEIRYDEHEQALERAIIEELGDTVKEIKQHFNFDVATSQLAKSLSKKLHISDIKTDNISTDLDKIKFLCDAQPWITDSIKKFHLFMNTPTVRYFDTDKKYAPETHPRLFPATEVSEGNDQGIIAGVAKIER